MSYADRMDAAFEQRDAELWDEHERGEHADPEPDCNRCARDMREGLNVEGDPSRNGAFDRW